MKSTFAFVIIATLLFSNSACVSLKMDSKKVTDNAPPENNQIDYYLRKKVFEVEVGYTITEYKKLRIVKGLSVTTNKMGNNTSVTSNQQYRVASEVNLFTDFELENSYTITEVLTKDPGQHFRLLLDTGKNGDFAKKKVSVNFDDATGLLTGINGEKTSIAPEVIKGSFALLGETVKVAAKASGFDLINKIGAAFDNQGNKPSNSENKNTVDSTQFSYDSLAITTRHIKEKILVDFDCTENHPVSVPIAQSFSPDSKPKLLFSLQCIKSCDNDCKDTCTCSKGPAVNTSLNGLAYRSPKPAIFSMSLSTNGLQQNIIQEMVLVPQFGSINNLPIDIKKAGKTNISIELTKEGDVKTYTIDKESNIDAILNNTAEGVGGVNSSLQDLSDALKAKQTGKLTSQKEQLELQKEILQLQKDIEELKNGTSE